MERPLQWRKWWEMNLQVCRQVYRRRLSDASNCIDPKGGTRKIGRIRSYASGRGGRCCRSRRPRRGITRGMNGWSGARSDLCRSCRASWHGGGRIGVATGRARRGGRCRNRSSWRCPLGVLGRHPPCIKK